MALGSRTVELIRAFIIASTLIAAAIISGCVSFPDPVPELKNKTPSVDIKIWVADFPKASVIRRHENQRIRCSDPAFGEFLAITFEDFDKLIGSCEEWK